MGAKNLGGAGSGGTGETRDMLDLCARNSISARTNPCPACEVDTGLDRLARNYVRYRVVLDKTR